MTLNSANFSQTRRQKTQIEYFAAAFRSIRRTQVTLDLEQIKDPGFVDLCEELRDVLGKLCLLPRFPNQGSA
ncbi:MAG: hypothetical protein ABI041_10775 [Bdellovibrionia bacterium]